MADRRCTCQQLYRTACMLTNAAPLYGGCDRCRGRAVNLADAFAALVTLRQFACGCQQEASPLPPEQVCAHLLHLWDDCQPNTPGLPRYCRLADARCSYISLLARCRRLFPGAE